MEEEYIFYGAGRHAKEVVKSMLSVGIVPVCFADRDESKHYTAIEIPISADKRGRVEVLPLDEAMALNPNANLYITIEPKSYQNVYDYLLRQGVPPNRIKGPPLYCELIGNFITITDCNIFTCCAKREPVRVPRSGDIRKDIGVYYTLCKGLLDDLREGKPTTCSGCQKLHSGRSIEDFRIKHLNLALTSVCNFNCCYCRYEPDTDLSDEVFTLLQYFNQEEHIEYVLLTTGEISVQKFRKEILTFLRKNKLNSFVYTNAAIYREEIRELLCNTSCMLNISLDAGTKETYARVKGVDCFDTVLQNIEMYAATAEPHQICLKYLVLETLNCDDRDIDSFIDIAAKLKAVVSISDDMFETFTIESAKVYQTVARLVRQCIAKEIPYRLSFLDKYYERLHRDGLLNHKLRFSDEKAILDKLHLKKRFIES